MNLKSYLRGKSFIRAINRIETLPRNTKDFTKQISCRAFSIELDDYLWQNNLKIDKRQYSRDIIEDLKNRYGKKNVQKQTMEKAI